MFPTRSAVEREGAADGDALAIDMPAARGDSGGGAAHFSGRRGNHLDGELAQIQNWRSSGNGGAHRVSMRRPVGGPRVALRAESVDREMIWCKARKIVVRRTWRVRAG